MNRPAIVFLFLAFAACSLSARQNEQSERDTSDTARLGIYPLPILFYTPETGVAGGAAALLLYRDSAGARASSITADVIYTEKRQFNAEISGDQYFGRGMYRLISYLSFQKYPNKFFGIGNKTPESAEEDYTPQSFKLNAALYRNVTSSFNAGPMMVFEHVTMKETDPAGRLAAGTIPGSTGGTLAGLGLAANWDSRDNTFAAHSGSFFQITTMLYREAWGSNYRYTDVQIDTRNFFQLALEHVVAIQAAARFIDGTPPFYRLTTFGGQNLVRGYFEGRYRGNDGIAFQAEYRFPVWWRFGMVAFAGAAQVAHTVGDLALQNFWFAGGAGIRFAWSPEERVNIRLDYGIGNGSTGMYVTVTEAF